MDLLDLYSPEELAEQRVSFLTRLLSMYDQGESPFELARTLVHKLQGTGGNLGIDGILEHAPGLQAYARLAKDETKVRELLDALRSAIAERCDQYRQEVAP